MSVFQSRLWRTWCDTQRQCLLALEPVARPLALQLPTRQPAVGAATSAPMSVAIGGLSLPLPEVERALSSEIITLRTQLAVREETVTTHELRVEIDQMELRQQQR